MRETSESRETSLTPSTSHFDTISRLFFEVVAVTNAAAAAAAAVVSLVLVILSELFLIDKSGSIESSHNSHNANTKEKFTRCLLILILGKCKEHRPDAVQIIPIP